MMATAHIVIIAIVLARFSECVVVLHLTNSFNKFTKLTKKKIHPVRDFHTNINSP